MITEKLNELIALVEIEILRATDNKKMQQLMRFHAKLNGARKIISEPTKQN